MWCPFLSLHSQSLSPSVPLPLFRSQCFEWQKGNFHFRKLHFIMSVTSMNRICQSHVLQTTTFKRNQIHVLTSLSQCNECLHDSQFAFLQHRSSCRIFFFRREFIYETRPIGIWVRLARFMRLSNYFCHLQITTRLLDIYLNKTIIKVTLICLHTCGSLVLQFYRGSIKLLT